MNRLLLVSLVFAATATTAAAAAADTPAKRAFGEGVRLFNAEDFVGATAAFERAYKLRPHHHVQCNITRCYEQRANVIKAARHYRRCLDEGAKRSASAAEVQASLLRMERQIAWLLVHSPKRRGAIVVDGRRCGATPRRVPVDPGVHVVEVRWRAARSASRTVSVRGGQRLRVLLQPSAAVPSRLTPSPAAVRKRRALATVPTKLVPGPAKRAPGPAKRKGISQWWFWSGVVLTAALTATAIVQSVETMDRVEAYEARPDTGSYDRAKRTRLLANLFWGGAVAAAGAATTLFFFTDFSTGQRERRVAVYGVGLRGSF
jgi:hypothetical protein